LPRDWGYNSVIELVLCICKALREGGREGRKKERKRNLLKDP
jgi:hypothetical protein